MVAIIISGKNKIPVVRFITRSGQQLYLRCLLLMLAGYLTSCAPSPSHSPPQTAASAHHLLGTCEGCEAVFEYGDKTLTPVDTLPDFYDQGTQIRVMGTIYEPDAMTPAKDVILYIYHTNQDGIYPTRGDETGWAKRHGYIRGWIKTGADGKYTFYTLKPGVYPDRNAPAHLHPIILEPDGKYYWIETYYFAGDTLLTLDQTSPIRPRGGTPGVLYLREKDGILTGRRDIILGRNIPGYQ